MRRVPPPREGRFLLPVANEVPLKGMPLVSLWHLEFLLLLERCENGGCGHPPCSELLHSSFP